LLSLPPRGAWIEMTPERWSYAEWRTCRSPRGERGLKSKGKGIIPTISGRRSPRGERGLKFGFASGFADY